LFSNTLINSSRSSVSQELLMGLSMSVAFFYELDNTHNPGSLLKQIVATLERDRCMIKLLQQWEPRSLLEYIVATIGNCINVGLQQLPRIALSQQWPWTPLLPLLFLSSKSTVPLTCGYQRSYLLTSPPMMWREEHLWHFNVLQGVHLFNLIPLGWETKFNNHINQQAEWSCVE
jgi:hypothetical protein